MSPAGQSSPRDALRVLVLSKRQYMGRDLLDDRYGRFRELPLALAARGASVHGLCLSYRKRESRVLIDEADGASVTWRSVNLSALPSLGRHGYLASLDQVGSTTAPNLVWACSDVPHALLGLLAARRLGARLVIDLYDNFESYPLARLPGVNRALAMAMRSADGVTCVSSPLRDYVRARYACHAPMEVIENAVDRAVFRPLDKSRSRQALGLPPGAILIGTAGAIDSSRGIELLFRAFAALADERPDVHLVLAGPLGRGLRVPPGQRIHYLGNLSPENVPAVLSSLDLAVVCNLDSAFGRYCFPQKLYEALACGLPIVAARIGATADLLREFPASTYEPADLDSLLTHLRESCAERVKPPLPIPTWQDQGARLDSFLRSIS